MDGRKFKKAKKIINSFRQKEEILYGKKIVQNNAHKAPDFMIFGAAKSGTTSLFQYLAQHPDIIPPKRKEIRYFGMEKQRRGLNWYLKQYPLKKEIGKEDLTFEATPTYMAISESRKQILHLFPNIKMIAILRDPIKRAYSHWNTNAQAKKNEDPRTFTEAINEEIEGGSAYLKKYPIRKYLYRSNYALQLSDWYQDMEANHILLIDFDDLKNNLSETLATITGFLNIENVYPDFAILQEKVKHVKNKKDTQAEKKLKLYNTGTYKNELDKETKTFLRKYFEKPNRALKELTGQEFSWMD